MSKKNKKALLTGAVLLVVLLAALVLVKVLTGQMEKKQQENSENEAAKAIVLSLSEKNMASITFTGDDGEIRMEQGSSGWMNAQDKYPLQGSRTKLLTDDLAALKAERTLENITDLSEYGLDHPSQKITVTMQDDKTYELLLGKKNTTTKQLYFQMADDPQTVYLTATALDSHFSGRVQDFAAYEDFPYIEPSTMREFDVQKAENSYVLTMTGDDKCSVTGDDGVTQLANLTTLGVVQNNISYISWARHMEYDCKDMAVYGLEEPQCTVKITYEVGDEEKILTIYIGDQDESDNYYVRLDDSTAVNTVREEYLMDLVENQATSYWSLTYSFVSISDLKKLTVTTEGESHTLEYYREEKEDGTDTEQWMFDGKEVEKDLFTRFYYDCVSVTAQERFESIPEDLGEPALSLHYELNDGSAKDITYYKADQNFYTVVYENGTKAASTNKLYVNIMLDDLKKLAGGI